MDRTKKFLLIIIVLMGFFLRFYQLSDIPSGIHNDEAAQGFNAISIIKTGKDMYGKSFPLLFRANGSYQPPVYTYFSVIPIAIFGNTIFAIRFISALSGSILIFVTFLIISKLSIGNINRRTSIALTAAAIVAFSPWSIHFSRTAVEANLALLLFISGVYMCLLSIKRKNFFLFGSVLLSVASYAYYTEKVTSIIFLFLFTFFFRRELKSKRQEVVISIIIFLSLQLPNIYLASTGALSNRLSAVGSFSSTVDNNKLKSLFVFASNYLDHYLHYYSPGNLFFDPGIGMGKITPDLAVFYSWMFVPFLIGVKQVLKRKQDLLNKTILLLGVITTIPVGTTGDVFYPLRVLSFLWVISVVISFGLYEIMIFLKSNFLRFLIVSGLVGYSLLMLYVSYFVLFKYSGRSGSGYYYVSLMGYLSKYRNLSITIDLNPSSLNAGTRLVYLLPADPLQVQTNLRPYLNSYYSSKVATNEINQIDNIKLEPINWAEECKKDHLFVGSPISISPKQALDHNLQLAFEIKDSMADIKLVGYLTNPRQDCFRK